VHVASEGISPELANILANPEPFGGAGLSWNGASAARLDLAIKAVEGKMKHVEERMTATEGEVKELHSRKVDKMDKMEESGGKSVETRGGEARKLTEEPHGLTSREVDHQMVTAEEADIPAHVGPQVETHLQFFSTILRSGTGTYYSDEEFHSRLNRL